MASNTDEYKSGLLTRRQALLSIASITAGAAISASAPRAIFGATPAKDKIKFIAIGDFGTGDEHQYAIADQMLRDHMTSPLDFVIAVGDNIYPDGGGRHFEKKFARPYAGLIRNGVKFHAVLGNHDVKDGRRDQIQYPLFNMNGHCYYTVKQGDGLAEFFMIDSTDFDMAQTGWLENSLKESTAKWKIAVFHHPIYSSAREHGSNLGLRSRIEPLVTRYGVNVVLSGHDHTYERVKPQQGVQYFVTGAGGKVRHGDVDMGSPLRAMSFDRDNHYLEMVIEDSQISFQTISRGGQLVDRGIVSPRAMAAALR